MTDDLKLRRAANDDTAWAEAPLVSPSLRTLVTGVVIGALTGAGFTAAAFLALQRACA